MKGRILLVMVAFMLLLAACGKSEDEKYLEKYTETLASYMRSPNIKVYRDGDSIYFCKSETMCFRYYIEPISNTANKEQHYKINKMSFNFDEIKPGEVYTVTYPDKIRDDEGDNPEIIDQLEKKFHEKLVELGYTWEKLDDFMVWFAYVESINFKGTHLFEDDYLEKLPE